jgi:hypothetical protein
MFQTGATKMTTISNRTFGVEIEIKGLGEYEAETVLVNAGINASRTGYTHDTTTYWKCLRDGSLEGTSCEVVSPVLSGEEGLEQIRKVCRAISSAGGRVDRQCGLHVHIGTDGLTANDVAMILSRYARFEATIDSWMPQSRRSDVNTYCRSITNTVRARVNGHTFNSVRDVASVMGGEHNRYVKVNMAAYYRHRTIEFRQHSGTINGSKIENWVRFILAFVEASRGQMVTSELPVGFVAETTNDDGGRFAPPPVRSSRSVTSIHSLEAKLDRVILAFRASYNQGLTIAQIAAAGGWSEASVAPYISRLRTERGCVLRKLRGSETYFLVGNSGRLTTDAASAQPAAPAVAVETQRAARRVVSMVGEIADDSVFRGIPADVVSFYEERAQELGGMNRY